MTEQEWLAALDTLTPEGRHVAQLAAGRMQHVLERFRALILSDIQQLERRLNGQSQRIAENTRELGALAVRVDDIADELEPTTDDEHPNEVSGGDSGG